MVKLFGKDYSPSQLQKYVGRMDQLAGVERMTLAEGPEAGVKVIRFRTGTGLEFTTVPSRGLDIATAFYKGAALAFHIPVGIPHPAFYDCHDLEWLKVFFGGLMLTCGLTHFGAPCEDQGEQLGLHGRYTSLAARNVYADTAWERGQYKMWVQGKIREANMFGPNILMERKISAVMGENKIVVEDRVTNEGDTKAPFQILYHCNFGFPLLDENSRIIVPHKSIDPMDEKYRNGIKEYDRFVRPQAGVAEQCYMFDTKTDRRGNVTVALLNEKFDAGKGLAVYMKYPKKNLDCFTEWKMMRQNNYVLGLEPGNSYPLGRDQEREAGRLKFLRPGEQKDFRLEFGIVAGKTEVKKLIHTLKS